ncbi:MAG: hypothetical protein OEY44_00130 [Candidatus Peregrinibacteria bacterium]|nr:hypothetical protein [Candidatus Peregrinibacteria bacterium]
MAQVISPEIDKTAPEMLEGRRLERLGDMKIAADQANQNKAYLALEWHGPFDALRLASSIEYRAQIRSMLQGLARRNEWKPEKEVTDAECYAEQLLAGIQHYEEILEEIREAERGGQR